MSHQAKMDRIARQKRQQWLSWAMEQLSQPTGAIFRLALEREDSPIGGEDFDFHMLVTLPPVLPSSRLWDLGSVSCSFYEHPVSSSFNLLLNRLPRGGGAGGSRQVIDILTKNWFKIGGNPWESQNTNVCVFKGGGKKQPSMTDALVQQHLKMIRGLLVGTMQAHSEQDKGMTTYLHGPRKEDKVLDIVQRRLQKFVEDSNAKTASIFGGMSS